ncbi:MAG: sulfatase-like hydrolase/transferase, partial [Bacteroidetes bacterium]|nr:sulfatase-like hydrolase/transferase [Bacteroidota bacterium]
MHLKNNYFMVIVGILLLGSCTNKSTPPNLLFVFPDQMRASTLGFMEKEPVMTPHLDRFASEGLVLTNAVSNAPVCSPYRAMM